MRQDTQFRYIILSVMIIAVIIVWSIILFSRSNQPDQPKPVDSVSLPQTQIPSKETESSNQLNPNEKLLTEAQKLYEQLQFDEAVEKLDAISDLNVSDEIFDQIDNLRENCNLCSDLLADISPAQMAEPEQLSSLEQEYRQRLNQLGSSPSAIECYQLGIFCYQNNLNDRVLGMLEKAITQDPDIVITVKDHQAQELYNIYRWLKKELMIKKAQTIKKYLLENYPETEYALELKEVPLD